MDYSSLPSLLLPNPPLMKRKFSFPAMKKSPAFSPTTSKARLRTFLETLEPRIAPAGLSGINYIDVVLGTPQLLKAGQGLKANGQYLIAVTQGEAMVFTTDLNGSNQFAPNDITGIAAGDGLKMTSFVNINGDIVTDLQSNGTLSDSSGNASGHNGLLLLDSKIDAITLRSVTPADITPADVALAQKTTPGATAASIYTNFLAPSTYSINGNIYAGGGVGDGVAGDGIVIDTAGASIQASTFSGGQEYYAVTGIAPVIGTIKTGTAAGGSTFSFGYYATSTSPNGAALGQQYIGTPGTIPTLAPFTPGNGEAGGSINGLTVGNGASTGSNSPVPFSIAALDAGNGGVGGAGGSISNIQLDGDTGGLQIVAGNGGAGPIGGNGGAITNLSDVGDGSVEGAVHIQTGNGGEGYLGTGGTGGALALGQFSMNGDVHISYGNGGNALGNAGSGNNLTNATLTPTDTGGIATAVSLITTYRTAGDIGTPKLIDFNDDGYTDAIFVTNSPDQVGIVFGGPLTSTGSLGGGFFGSGYGFNANSPVLYLTAPGIGAQLNNNADIVVGDFTGQYYADGTPILDIAIANSTPNNTNAIEVFLNPATQSGLGDGYQGEIGVASGPGSWSYMAVNGAATGQNFIATPTINVQVPVLSSQYDGQYLYSGAAITNLVVGDFNHATYSTEKPNAPGQNPILDLAYSTDVFAPGLNPYTAVVMLQGTGDGHFFANFDYNSATFLDTNMPVLNAGSTFVNAHGSTLAATAAVSGDINSDILLAGGSGYNLYIAQDLNPNQQAYLLANPGTGTGNTSFNSDINYAGFSLASTADISIFYDTAIYSSGAIVGFTPVPANPVAIAVTTHPGPVAGTDQSGQVFAAITLDTGGQNIGITTIQGAYTPVPGSVAGIASVSNNLSGPAIQGVALEDSNNGGILDPNGPGLYGIVAGDFQGDSTTGGGGLFGGTTTTTTAAPEQFAVYGSAAVGRTTGLFVLDLANNGLLHLANSYDADLTLNTTIDALSPVGGYTASVVAFSPYNLASHTETTNTVTNAVTTTFTNTLTSYVGYIAAVPTNNADNAYKASAIGLIEGWGTGINATTTTSGGLISTTTASVELGLNTYSLTLSAGNGGNSRLGSGGHGGNVGSTNPAVTNTLTITLPTTVADQPDVVLNCGAGGSGLINGGAGGGEQNMSLLYATGTGTLGGSFTLQGADGGAGLFGSGGAGGSLVNLQVQTGVAFIGGNGGSGYRGGAGGIINGNDSGTSSTAELINTQEAIILLQGGIGGNGIVGGGAGGSILGFVTEFLPLVSGVGGYLNYAGGAGGSAIAGPGGAGGSITNSSPLGIENNMAGPLILAGGAGGNGLSGGVGGSITNFSNQSTSGTTITVVAIQAGNGGTGTNGNGGAGGNLSNIAASGLGIDNTYGYQYNSILAGDGGNSYGGNGGNGGSVTSVNSIAQSSAEAVAAGVGGDGLKKGGNGGVISNDTADSANSLSSKLLVFAGAGGNAYAALATAPGLGNAGDTTAILALRAFGGVNGAAGNGGSITNFTQPKSTETSVDLIAGNGGSLENYGSNTAATLVGTGGSMTNVKLAGNVGRTNSTSAILNYNNGDITGFVQNTLAYVPATVDIQTLDVTLLTPQTQLTDSEGNVGAVVGASGSIKDGGAAGDAVSKTGSVTTFSANSIMSMVAGSVDRIAAINTISGLTVLTGNATAGSYKNTPVEHGPDTAIYYNADGSEFNAPTIGGALMDGGIIFLNNPGNLVGQRIWQL